MELDCVPEHLLVLGGGYVGLEFGQLFRRLGSRVTIVQSAGQLLDREDADVAEGVQAILEQDGIEVLLKAKAERAGKSGGQIQLTVREGNEPRNLVGSHLLVATGRTPNTDSLTIGAACIDSYPQVFIKVNGKLVTIVICVYGRVRINGGY